MSAMGELYMEVCEIAGLNMDEQAEVSMRIVSAAFERINVETLIGLELLSQDERISFLAELTAAQIPH